MEAMKDSEHQRLMDEAYARWEGVDWSYAEFLDHLGAQQVAAVLLGNLNEQLSQEGGFLRWAEHGFASQGIRLLSVLDDMDHVLDAGVAATILALVSDALVYIRRYRSDLENTESEAYQCLISLNERFRRYQSSFLADCELYLLKYHDQAKVAS
jgi:hypothetical protein